MIKKILIATDGSDTALNAGSFAVDMAAQLKSDLYGLYVADALEHLAGMGIAEMHLAVMRDTIVEQMEAEGQEALNKIKRLARDKGVNFKGEVVKGHDPVHEIIRAAKKEKADLIVVGSHGKKTALIDLALGEIPPKLLAAKLPCPVTVVKPS